MCIRKNNKNAPNLQQLIDIKNESFIQSSQLKNHWEDKPTLDVG
jgi:hypothetical protein